MPKDEFYAKLDALVSAAKQIRRDGTFGPVDPEEATKDKLIDPLLESLGYTAQRRDKEFHITGEYQVDYLLKRDRPLLLLEAKSLLDKADDLFKKHQAQVTQYIRNYRFDPYAAKWERPVYWIVLTNFAQFHFIRVNEEVPTFSFRLDELIPRRDELWDLLAPENVEHDRIDDIYAERQHADLDKRFLADLKRWRLIIANGFALRNQGRPLADLTKASQQLLDRFIFCRMLETNHLIDHNKLIRQFVGYEEFFGAESEKSFSGFLRESLFREIKRNFNTELFQQPLLCDELLIDNIALATVIGHQPLTPDVAALAGLEQGPGEMLPFKHLYGYDFSKMSTDIMGAVYERFLAHQLTEKAGRIVIEDTDDLRKKEGIYYTPRYIVDYIVEQTVGAKIKPVLQQAIALLDYKNYTGAQAKILELAQIKVLDPAMGSGSFLLRAFDAFVQAYAAYNAECEHARQANGVQENLLFENAGKPLPVDRLGTRVAAANIFGVDLDDQAVEVAKLNLWIRLMTAERESIQKQLTDPARRNQALNLLPTLANNLKRGNSLIGSPIPPGCHPERSEGSSSSGPEILRSAQNDNWLKEVCAFDWNKEFPGIQFDCVIGNPPYERIQTMMGSAPKVVEFLKANYQSAAAGNFDIYVCFIERGLQLLAPTGTFGYIAPHKFFQAEYGAGIRKLLSDGQHVRKVVSFGDLQVFPQVSTYTCLLFLANEKSGSVDYSLIGDIEAFADSRAVAQNFAVDAGTLTEQPWNFIGATAGAWMKKAEHGSKPLGKVAEEIFVGLQTSADDVFLFERVLPVKGVCEVFSVALNARVKIEAKLLKAVVRSGSVGRYWAEPTYFVLFPYRVRQGEATLLTQIELRDNFPLAWDYLKQNETALRAREKGAFDNDCWYEMGRTQNLGMWETPKLMVPYMIQELSAFHDDNGHYLVNVTTGGYGLRSSTMDLRLLTALLNSQLLDAYFKQVSSNFRGGYFAANKQFIERLPIKPVEAKSKTGKELIKLVDAIQAAHRQRLQLPQALATQIAHSHRTPCSLAHYLQKDYAGAVKETKLIDDVQRKGFVTGIAIAAAKNQITITAEVADTKQAVPVSMLVLRLTFTNEPLQHFIFAALQSFLAANARKKVWTPGKTAQSVYDLIVNSLEPLVFFLPDAAENLRAIRELMKAVAKEAGTADLAAVEAEIAETDAAINTLVYELYGLTAEEQQLVERSLRS